MKKKKNPHKIENLEAISKTVPAYAKYLDEAMARELTAFFKSPGGRAFVRMGNEGRGVKKATMAKASQSEIRAIAGFFRGEAGKRFLKYTPRINRDLKPLALKIGMDIIKKHQGGR